MLGQNKINTSFFPTGMEVKIRKNLTPEKKTIEEIRNKGQGGFIYTMRSTFPYHLFNEFKGKIDIMHDWFQKFMRRVEIKQFLLDRGEKYGKVYTSFSLFYDIIQKEEVEKKQIVTLPVIDFGW